MALVVKDRVKETTTTTGTGTITLGGAVTGFQSFSVIGDGNTTHYAVVSGNDWEVGVGTYTASGATLSRDTILESSNAGAAITLAGTSNVFCTYPAEKSLNQDDIGTLLQAYDADTAKYDDTTANFTGTLQNGGSNVVVDTDIGSTVQAYDADTAKYDDTTANFTGTLQNGGSNVVVDTDIGVTVQGYDADTAKYDDVTANFTGTLQNGGSNVVVDSDIGSTVQAYDADLTALGGLAKTDGNFIVGDGSTWVAESGATVRTSLGLGSLATLSTVDAATITDNSVGADELDVTGDGTSGQVLSSDGDGSMTWTSLPASGFSNMEVFTSTGTWTNPGSVTKVKVTVQAGGGGGAGAPGDGGSSGGAGGTAIEVETIPTSPVSVTVGAAGTAGPTSAPGGTGGTSSFGAYCSATGGGGGGPNGADAGTGGSASGGTINILGGDGFSTVYAASLNHGGPGGSSYFGGGGKGRSFYSPSKQGQPGRAYGSGGGAGLNGQSGGAGAAGVVIVEW